MFITEKILRIIGFLALFILVFVLILILIAKNNMGHNQDNYSGEYMTFDENHNISYFSEENPRFKPSEEESLKALSLIQSFLAEHKDELQPLSNYKVQVFGWINSNGEKILWANYLGEEKPEWKEKVIIVRDGGNYFFNVKVNLAIGQVYDFSINGEA